MSRVMLTGASGFLGRSVLAALTAAGHEVHALARRAGPQAPGVSWHEIDLLDGAEIVGEVRPEILVHLAWYAEHGRFWTSLENVRWVEGSLALLRAFAAAGGQRVVMAGTCAEYEWSREVYAESAPCRPATLYGACKHGLRVVAEALSGQVGLSFAWGRIFFLYGPGEVPTRFVPSLVLPLLKGEPARMTEGSQLRDLLHVADAGSAFAALADSSLSGVINIGSGIGVALSEVATSIAGHTGSAELLEIGALAQREGEPPSLVAGVRRLEGELGWRPRIALEVGLAETVEWWRARAAAQEHPGPP